MMFSPRIVYSPEIRTGISDISAAGVRFGSRTDPSLVNREPIYKKYLHCQQRHVVQYARLCHAYGYTVTRHHERGL